MKYINWNDIENFSIYVAVQVAMNQAKEILP